MSLAFTDILETRVDGLSPSKESLITDFWKNQLALIAGPIPVQWAEVNETSSSFALKATIPLWIPPAAAATEKDVSLLVVFEAYNQNAGAVGRARIKLGAGSYVETGDITATAPTRTELRIAAADVRAVAGSEANLILEMKRVSGTGQVRTRNTWDVTRLEVAP